MFIKKRLKYFTLKNTMLKLLLSTNIFINWYLISDFLKHLFDSNKPIFYFAGGLMSVSMVFLSLLPLVKERARKEVENI